jgi:hypothetical protein
MLDYAKRQIKFHPHLQTITKAGWLLTAPLGMSIFACLYKSSCSEAIRIKPYAQL